MDLKKENRGGARQGAGRKSREDLGLEPLVTTSVKVEQTVIDACISTHGSLANALRYAAKSKKKPLK
ncbi:hypothetical protein LWM68_41080 [Niabella sp. W65]|nr:hypothetical protein [Niabella sp. W65]MCH7368568.1 hypothetical protein [Niabella sp. W65]